MALKSLLIGAAIGTTAALLLPKLVRRGAFTHDWTHDHWREGQLEPEDSRSETHVPNFTGVPEQIRDQPVPHVREANVGQTVSRTESELRRTRTNPVHYTTDPSASPASGGTAPFLKEKKKA